MKKILLMLLLLTSTNSFAEWTEVAKTQAHSYTTYIDFKSIRSNGSKVRLWDLYDYNRAKKLHSGSKEYYLSALSHHEYDCVKQTIRELDLFRYSKNMRDGVMVYSKQNINSEPESILPSSIHEGLLKLACEKK
ncbi:hypothetical protein LBMAG43_16700 [Methylococcaceae bacterium]|jgi:hypothetical protein|nr:hypothetical protein [Methylococcales bacterium]GDX85628.1 hypothetical protein LBMAG43_16700 [Methylococcaceae bacterium]